MSTKEPGALEHLRAEAARLGVVLDADALDKFARYLTLLDEWRDRAGLTALSDHVAIQRRHFGEALALVSLLVSLGYVSPERSDRVIDIGSGAGFPGLPMRIVLPSLKLTLLEAHGRRADFLRLAAAELGFDDVNVVKARAEEAGRDPVLRESFDLAVARALAPLNVLAEYALPLLHDGGLLIAPKGSRALAELDEAQGALVALSARAETPVPLPLPDDLPPQTVLLLRRAGPLDVRYPRRPGVPSRRPLT